MKLQTQNQQRLEFSQGDNVTLTLVATDDAGNPVDLTLATFSTEILGANGVGPVTFPNTQHTIVDGPNGVFSLALSPTDSGNCGLGEHKQILTQITIGGLVQTYRGVDILTVYPGVPTQ